MEILAFKSETYSKSDLSHLKPKYIKEYKRAFKKLYMKNNKEKSP